MSSASILSAAVPLTAIWIDHATIDNAKFGYLWSARETRRRTGITTDTAAWPVDRRASGPRSECPTYHPRLIARDGGHGAVIARWTVSIAACGPTMRRLWCGASEHVER